MHNILEKYWYLLLGDKHVAKFVSPCPSVTYRKAASIGDFLVHSDFNKNPDSIRITPKGLWKCGGCRACTCIQEGDHLLLPNGYEQHLKQHITCDTAGIVYIMVCICGCFYIEKTRRPFGKRIGDHLGDIRGGRVNRPVCRHEGLCHKFDIVIKFYPLESIPMPLTEGDWDYLILHRETKWIVNLKETECPGLNDTLSFKSFL